MTPPPAATARQLAILIAVGIGLHNFAEGLAIGQSAAPQHHRGLRDRRAARRGARPADLGVPGRHGALGGGPTVLGTIVGQAVVNTTLSVAFLGLAAGSILYMIIELLGVNRAFGLKVLASAGILVGMLLGFGTDFILVALGGLSTRAIANA
jgi:ZIP family zinc transporter